MNSRWCGLGGAALVALLSLGSMGPAMAESVPQRSGLETGVSSKNPQAIRHALMEAIRVENRARQQLVAENTKEAERLIYSGYVKIRVAHEAINLRISHAKFPDPRLVSTSKTIKTLRFHILTALGHAKHAKRYGARAIDEAIQNLDKAIPMLRQAERGVY